MRTCPDCGCRVYSLGCVNCDEDAYIEEQIQLTERYGEDDPPRPDAAERTFAAAMAGDAPPQESKRP